MVVVKVNLFRVFVISIIVGVEIECQLLLLLIPFLEEIDEYYVSVTFVD